MQTALGITPQHVDFQAHETDYLPSPKPSTLLQKIARIVYNILSVVIFPIGLCRLGYWSVRYFVSRMIFQAPLKQAMESSGTKFKEAFLRQNEGNATSKQIKTLDGALIDSVEINHPSMEGVGIEKQKYLVFMPGTGGNYEKSLRTFQKMANDIGANALVFNYRGVGSSKGCALSSKELVMDGDAVIQYLLDKGIQEENILIHGYSLGGAVGAQVAAYHPKVHLCCDRTFSNLTKQAYGFFGEKIARVGAKLANWMEWRFDSVKNYQAVEGKKWVIFVRASKKDRELMDAEDSIIAYEASLYKALKEAAMTLEQMESKKEREALKEQGIDPEKNYDESYKPERIRIKEIDSADCWGENLHCSNLSNFGQAYTKHIELCRQALFPI
ncbi:alpha/beta fold hydrolase [Simkania negevensis]|uniref:Alpha/beta fold hydrolase n=1 Tax=Simkania negevensis TaxID=83561 RepID=A0ABS3AUC3_9BACT|nr:alpha/beta fold hydrolase [Simkania negevensis]